MNARGGPRVTKIVTGALDELRWVAARIRLDHDSGNAEAVLDEDAQHVIRLLTDAPGVYSDGSDVWTHRRIAGHEQLVLNNPPHRIVLRR